MTNEPNADDGMIRRIVEAERRERENAVGSNGGRLCDTRSGPCSCGAWH